MPSTPAPFATIADLQNRLGYEIADRDLPQAEAALDDASALVRTVAGSEVAPLAVPDVVRTVVLQVALRIARNPQGFRSESVGLYRYDRGGTNSPAGYLTDNEIRIIRRAVSASPPLRTLPVERDNITDTSAWASAVHLTSTSAS